MSLSDYDKLSPIFWKEFQTPPPSPASSIIVVAKEPSTGRIVGVLCAQSFVHIEPIWVAEEYRGRGIVESLGRKLKAILKTGMAFAYTTSPRVGKLLDRLGLEHMEDWRVYRWVATK